MPTRSPASTSSNPLKWPCPSSSSSSSESELSDSFRILSDSSGRALHDDYNVKASPNGSDGRTPEWREAPSASLADGGLPSDQDHRIGRGDKVQSPSESGTEADDEGNGLTKALPAPSVKPRKGLRDSTGVGIDGDFTPILTPSIIDEEATKQANWYFQQPQREKAGRRSSTEEERRRATEKLKRRRRAELIRRTLETILLGAVACSVLYGPRVWELAWTRHRGELISFVATITVLVLSYPLRLLLHFSTLAPIQDNRSRPHIRIPSAFDPATLLYPTLLPVLVALSLLPSHEDYLLPTLILGLASLPSRLIPKVGHGHGYNTVHWLITLIPLLSSECKIPYLNILQPKRDRLEARDYVRLSPGILTCLYPLHAALLSLPVYLVSTSLLTAELQLLSASLICILLFSASPQATILQSLFWIGGLLTFILCGHVLRWGVTLARIPKLRFRQTKTSVKPKNSIAQIIKESLRRSMYGTNPFGRQHESIPSDADDTSDDDASTARFLTRKGQLKTRTSSLPAPTSFVLEGCEFRLAIDDARQSEFVKADQHDGDLRYPKVASRRATLPSMNGGIPSPPPAPLRSRKRAISSSLQPYLQLTPTQATFRKWLYAIYVYVAILTIIFAAIRSYVGSVALGGMEPVGWALGYLFGDLRAFRHLRRSLDLEDWIALPTTGTTEGSLQPNAWAERLRQVAVGEANTRLLLSAFYIATISAGLLAVLRLPIVEVDTRRKVFHGMMVAMFLPTIFIDPVFVALALSLVLAIFLLLELIRASQLPPISRPLALFLQPYVDGRDLRGPVIVSHIFLLIGCAIPLWLSLAGIKRTGNPPWQGWEVQKRDMSMVTGVVCVGMGDAAASLIGRRYGRRRWPWAGGKSLEGSLAFVLAVMIGLISAKAWLNFGGWEQRGSTEHRDTWVVTVGKAAIAASGASFMEAVLTGGNDNVFVPIILWLLVRALEL